MPRYEIIGPDGKVSGTASELNTAKEIASHATKSTGQKHSVKDTSSIKSKNEEVLKNIRNIRGGRGGAGGVGLFGSSKIR